MLEFFIALVSHIMNALITNHPYEKSQEKVAERLRSVTKEEMKRNCEKGKKACNWSWKGDQSWRSRSYTAPSETDIIIIGSRIIKQNHIQFATNNVLRRITSEVRKGLMTVLKQHDVLKIINKILKRYNEAISVSDRIYYCTELVLHRQHSSARFSDESWRS